MKDKENRSKHLAFLLRHDKDYNFFKPDGWREIEDLVKNHGYRREELEEIVVQDNKGRYEISKDGRKIRALQGHSIPGIEPDLEECIPPEVLYHGTSSRFLQSIWKDGLKKMGRNHVHLSGDLETASKVGIRHGGSLVILVIDTQEMVKDGFKFYQSKNGVWLISSVPPKYFKECKYVDDLEV